MSIISVENLSKQYRIGEKASYKTLRETLMNAIMSPAKLFRGNGNDEDNTIWALKDVSFEVKEGEVLGIIGRNGAGKSTLLKTLSRVTEPTEGEIRLSGRVASLLEVGTGFHPELTGRENIFLNGSILGMCRQEIKSKFDEIVAFAEVEKFIDTPVKRYSSGMYVRLAFAVAAHLEPEILIVDEVLAVGDAVFQKKCLGKMGEVAKGGRTVLFVSHNMVAIKSLCQKAILLDKGKLIKKDSSAVVVNDYISTGLVANSKKMWDTIESAPGGDEVRVKSIFVRSLSDESDDFIMNDKALEVGVDFWSLKDNQNLALTLHFLTSDGIVVFSSSTIHHPAIRANRLNRGFFSGICHIPPNFLNCAVYVVRLLVVLDQAKVVFQLDDALTFEVADSGNARGAYFGKRPGVVAPLLGWDVIQHAGRRK